MTPVLLSWSGGKDAAWTLHVLRQQADVDVVGLLAMVDADSGRAVMQAIAHDVLQAQADAAGLPLLEARLPHAAPNALYEQVLGSALDSAARRWPGLRTMAFGDLFLADIRDYRQALCARLGWTALFPLFGSDTAALARTMIAAGLRARLCCIDGTQLDPQLLGRPFDEALLQALPARVDPCGERGEFHTCVQAGPMLAHPLALEVAGTWCREQRFACLDLVLAPGASRPADLAGHRCGH